MEATVVISVVVKAFVVSMSNVVSVFSVLKSINLDVNVVSCVVKVVSSEVVAKIVDE